MKRNKYTLIELLISMGIFAVMMLLLLNFFSKYQDFTYRAGLRNERNADAQTLFAQMEKDLKGISILQDSGGVTIGAKIDSTALNFYSRSALGDENNTGIGGLAHLEYTFSASDKVIYRTTIAASSSTKADLGASLPAIPALSRDNIILSGVKSLTLSYYPTKNLFRSGTSSPSSSALVTSVYAILITVTVVDANSGMSDTEKDRNALSFSKLVIVDRE